MRARKRAAHDLLSVGGREAPGKTVRDVSPTVSRSSDRAPLLTRIGYRLRAQVRLRLAVPRSPRHFEHGSELMVARYGAAQGFRLPNLDTPLCSGALPGAKGSRLSSGGTLP